MFFEEENIHTLSMDGELLLTILSSVAQQEVENISEHVKAGMQHKMANGILVGFNGCLGYDYHPEDRSLTINEEEAKVVRFIFQKCLEGYGPRMIRNELEKEGIPTKKGLKEWSEAAIRGILNNEKYTGDVILGKTITVDPINKKRARNYGESDQYLIRNHHEAIISKEDFDTVQALMKKRSENWHSDEYGNRMRYSNKYPFSNVARCGFCYAPLNRRSFHANSEKYKRVIWDCSRRIRRGKKFCVNSKAVHEEMLEKAFVACFNKLVKEKNEIIIDLIESSKGAIFHTDINAELAENRKKQKDITDRNLRMIDLLMEEKINNDEYEAKRQENILKLERLKEEEENLKNAYKRQEDSFRSIDDFKKVLSGSECLESFSPEIFDLLVETILVGGYTNGEPDPYLITFVFKGGSQRSIDGSGFKEDRRRKKALHPVWNSEGVEFSWCMSISGTNYEYLYLLDFTLFYRHYTYNLIDPISRERTVTDGVHVFAALDLVYSYTIHAKNPNVLKHKIFNYSIRFKGTHSDAETADYLGITRMRVAKLAREMNEEEYAKWHPGSDESPESEKDGDQSAE